jgi:RimJ/RimL family protein N-acetyltransferase
VRLIACRDADFDWMAGGPASRTDLRLPVGGVDSVETLLVVRAIHEAMGEDAPPSTWMMVSEGEVVGLCGLVRPPGEACAEIGYSVAPAHRRRGHATTAVGLLCDMAIAAGVSGVTAATAVDNHASQSALARNGFVEVGREDRDDEGPVILWRRDSRLQQAPVVAT